jgi:hypothetical protein
MSNLSDEEAVLLFDSFSVRGTLVRCHKKLAKGERRGKKISFISKYGN